MVEEHKSIGIVNEEPWIGMNLERVNGNNVLDFFKWLFDKAE